MTTTPTPETPGPQDQGPRVSRDDVRDLGRLRRTSAASPERRYIAGVSGGLARHLDIDPVVVRIALVVLLFFGGAGLILYIAGWLFVPNEETDEAVINLDPRSRTVVFYIAGAIALLAMLGDTVGDFQVGWVMVPLAVVAVLLLVFKNSGQDSRSIPPTGTAAGPAGAGAGTAPDPSVESAAHAPGLDTTTPPTTASAGSTPSAAGDTAPLTGISAELADRAIAESGGSGGAPTAPSAPPATPPARPRDPRRRGPLLFWWTLGLIAVALGTLGIVDAAGADVADSAYPALALGITGAMLVLGAFWGRAGGLILFGLLTTVGLVGAVGAQEWDHTRLEVTPTSSADLENSYQVNGGGEIVLDLTEIRDLEALDGRDVELDGDAGRIEVIVPEEVGVQGTLSVDGPGSLRAFDQNNGGIDLDLDVDHPGTTPTTINLDADLSVGEIMVRTQ